MESIYNRGRIAPISIGSKQSNANGPVNQMLCKTEMKALDFRGRIQSKMTISNAQMVKQNQEGRKPLLKLGLLLLSAKNGRDSL